MKTSYLVNLISLSYLKAKRALKEDELGLYYGNRSRIEEYKKIVNKIEFIVENLDEDDKYILQNELILRKKGEWYFGYLSTSTYYRHKKKAHKNFIDCMK